MEQVKEQDPRVGLSDQEASPEVTVSHPVVSSTSAAMSSRSPGAGGSHKWKPGAVTSFAGPCAARGAVRAAGGRAAGGRAAGGRAAGGQAARGQAARFLSPWESLRLPRALACVLGSGSVGLWKLRAGTSPTLARPSHTCTWVPAGGGGGRGCREGCAEHHPRGRATWAEAPDPGLCFLVPPDVTQKHAERQPRAFRA